MKGTGAAQPPPEPGWLQPPRARTRRDPSRVAFLTGRPTTTLAEAYGSREDQPMAHHTPSQDSPRYQPDQTLPRMAA